MARSNLTSEKRSFGKNDKSFVKDSSGEPIAVSVKNDLGTDVTTVIVNPRTLQYTGPNGEDISSRVVVDRVGPDGEYTVPRPVEQ